jgi:hypothetical protein
MLCEHLMWGEDLVLFLIIAAFALAYAFVLVVLFDSSILASDWKSGRDFWNLAPLEPIDATGWTLFIDTSNLCRDGDMASLQTLYDVMRKLKKRFENVRLVWVCDQSLKHKFPPGEREVFSKLLFELNVVEVPHADGELLRLARTTPRSIVVSNDWFGEPALHRARRGVPLLRMDHPGQTLRTSVVRFFSDARPHQETWTPVARYIQRENERLREQ